MRGGRRSWSRVDVAAWAMTKNNSYFNSTCLPTRRRKVTRSKTFLSDFSGRRGVVILATTIPTRDEITRWSTVGTRRDLHDLLYQCNTVDYIIRDITLVYLEIKLYYFYRIRSLSYVFWDWGISCFFSNLLFYLFFGKMQIS